MICTESGSFVLVDVDTPETTPQIKATRLMEKVDACRWLIQHGKPIPDELQELAARQRG